MTITQEVEIVNPAERGSPGGGLGSKVRRGAAWSAGGQFAGQLIQLGSTAVLARLLSPTDFGLAGLVAVVTALLATVMDCGIPTAIVRAPRLTERFLSTAFYSNLALAIAMTLLMCGLALPISQYFDAPELAWLMLLGSLTFPLKIVAVQGALMRRSMQFARLARIGMIGALVNTGVTVLCAMAGLGAASIILGSLAVGIVYLVQASWVVRWWPRPNFSAEEARGLWRFGRGILGSNIVTQITYSSDRILIGRVLDVAAVGYWTRTMNLLTLPMRQSVGVLGQVFFSALAKMADDLPRLRSAWLTLLRATWILGLPVAAGMAACAPAFVGTVYGPQWMVIVPLLIITTAALPLWMVTTVSRPVYEALGRTGLSFRITLLDSAIYIVLIVIGLQWGLMGVATATLVRAPITAVLTLVPLMRMLGLRWLNVISCAWRSALATAAMVPAVLAVPRFLPDAPPWLTLVCQVMGGGIVYVVGIWTLERQTFERLLGRSRN